jgi:hypothetical protein
MSELPPIPPTQDEIKFLIDRLTWTNAVRYFVPAAGAGPVYLRTDLTADRAPLTHQACLVDLMANGSVTTDEPGTECRLPVPERGRITLIPLALTWRGRRYLRKLIDATTARTTPPNNR